MSDEDCYELSELHVMPPDDCIEHKPSPDCECNPTCVTGLDEDAERWVHNTIKDRLN